MTQSHRIKSGGLIDRSRLIDFTFDGLALSGYKGDTLASALLANNQHLVARSIKYHRPRGILSAGLEETSALVTVDNGTGRTPNLKVTEVVLSDGLSVTSQNNWPRLDRDAGALLQLGSKMLRAGFYYKTFMWPRDAWYKTYAKIIRKAAGHGRVDPALDSALYDKRTCFCDVLVIGSGPAGLSAARTAAHAGATTIIIEHDQHLGGSLNYSDDRIEGIPAPEWAQDTIAAFNELSNVTVMSRTLAFGQYDHGLVQAVETLPADRNAKAILWKIRAKRIILAAGAIERPHVFPGNDRPGIMLAASVRQYIRKYAVLPGKNAVVAVSDPDERAQTARALQDAGSSVQILDDGDTLIGTRGTNRIRSVKIQTAAGKRRTLRCDLLCVSAGWMPTAHLFAHIGEKLTFNAETHCLLPPNSNGILYPVGGARGVLGLDDCLTDGKAATHQALGELELHIPKTWQQVEPTEQRQPSQNPTKGKAFVDLQNDVTFDDVAQAVQEGYDDIELAKRYTTLGMGTDQGKTSWTNGILALSSITGRTAETIGHTTYRPPYSPVSIGALVGVETGLNMAPIRRTPFQRVFEAAGCVFQTSGEWLYSRYFPKNGETMSQSVDREVRAVRSGLGCVDMSTLGKVDVKGPDALEFLSRLYSNNFATIKTGRLRYGLMLREDGYVYDDGTIARLGEEHFLVTMTTANAGSVWRQMQKFAQVDWPELDISITSVTDHWASLAIAGPDARNLMEALEPDFPVDRDSFPFASVREGTLAGDLPVRAFSVSFSGELSYELNVPAGYAEILFDRVIKHGAKWGITPYGLETLDVLRIEKGHLSIGTEIDGRRTPEDLGLGGLVSKKKDFIGRALLARPALQADGRAQLVGLTPVDKKTLIPYAAHLTENQLSKEKTTAVSQGYLTASIYSHSLGYPFALAFLESGQARIGQRIWAVSPVADTSVEVEITASCLYDPKGERLHG